MTRHRRTGLLKTQIKSQIPAPQPPGEATVNLSAWALDRLWGQRLRGKISVKMFRHYVSHNWKWGTELLENLNYVCMQSRTINGSVSRNNNSSDVVMHTVYTEFPRILSLNLKTIGCKTATLLTYSRGPRERVSPREPTWIARSGSDSGFSEQYVFILKSYCLITDFVRSASFPKQDNSWRLLWNTED